MLLLYHLAYGVCTELLWLAEKHAVMKYASKLVSTYSKMARRDLWRSKIHSAESEYLLSSEHNRRPVL